MPTTVTRHSAAERKAKQSAPSSKRTQCRTIVFAGGGSGGHISPGLAIAERLVESGGGAGVDPLFLCSSRAIDRTFLSETSFRFESLEAAPFGLRPSALLRFIRGFRRSDHTTRSLLSACVRPCVVALGGFVSAPVVHAATRCGIPTVLLNLDAVPGKANRLLARRCDMVLSAVETPGMPQLAERVVGLPVRRAAIAPGDAAHCRQALGLESERPTLLITGASQGSASMNALMAALLHEEAAAFQSWQVYHLCGPTDLDRLRQAYVRAGVRAVVEPFLREMGLAWGAADLVVSRAGANSVAEARANAVPTLFLPYPYHRDLHQQHNARPMADLGGAVVERDAIEPSANLAGPGRILRELMSDQPRRQAMREVLLANRPDDAASLVAEIVLGLNDR